MNKIIIVKDVLGENFGCQDAILLKGIIKDNIDDNLVLDFSGVGNVPTTFFYTLLSDIICQRDRNYIFQHLIVNNLSNYEDYKMVVLGKPSIMC